MAARITEPIISARGSTNNCPTTSVPRSISPDTRVTSVPAATEVDREGLWATSASPTESSEYVSAAVPIVMPCFRLPTTMPPIRLTMMTRMLAMASPLTNLSAPSMEPNKWLSRSSPLRSRLASA